MTKLYLIGDIHGDFRFLSRVVYGLRPNLDAGDSILQVGDIGFWQGLRSRYEPSLSPVYFIDGNHDDVAALINSPTVEPWPQLRYVRRGDMLVTDHARVLCVGGASSIDRAFRNHRIGLGAWFEEEDVTDDDVAWALEQAKRHGGVDLLVTHAVPLSVVRRHWPPLDFKEWKLPLGWKDVSAERIDQLWKALDKPPLVCGHMHRSVQDGTCRVLDINEVYAWER